MVKHYEPKKGDVQPVDLIESQLLDFNEGCIVKYVCRWKRKDGILDLKKAYYYLVRLIANAEKERDENDSE